MLFSNLLELCQNKEMFLKAIPCISLCFSIILFIVRRFRLICSSSVGEILIFILTGTNTFAE